MNEWRRQRKGGRISASAHQPLTPLPSSLSPSPAANAALAGRVKATAAARAGAAAGYASLATEALAGVRTLYALNLQGPTRDRFGKVRRERGKEARSDDAGKERRTKKHEKKKKKNETHSNHPRPSPSSSPLPPIKLLLDTRTLGTRAGFLRGLGAGLTNAASLAGYAAALAYGGSRVLAGAYTGGAVVNVLFAAMSAGFALAQVIPAAGAVGLGAAAAGRMLDVVDG